MASTKITDWLGEGTHAARPAVPPITPAGISFYYETDTTTLFMYDLNTAAWIAVGSGVSLDSSRFSKVPANPGWDPLMIYNNGTVLSGSNKIGTPASSSPYNYNYGTPAVYTGKKYFEFICANVGFCSVGICGAAGHYIDTLTGSPGNFGEHQVGQIGWNSSGTVKAVPWTVATPVLVSTIQTFVANDVCCVAVDVDNNLIWFRTNGGNWNNAAIGSQNPVGDVGGIPIALAFSNAANGLLWPGANNGSTSAMTLRLKTADFTQAVPTGYSSWSGL